MESDVNVNVVSFNDVGRYVKNDVKDKTYMQELDNVVYAIIAIFTSKTPCLAMNEQARKR